MMHGQKNFKLPESLLQVITIFLYHIFNHHSDEFRRSVCIIINDYFTLVNTCLATFL